MSAIDNSEDGPLQSDADEAGDPNLALFTEMKKDIKDAERERSAWRKDAQQCYDYVAGHQWDAKDKQILADENRPAVVFNRVAPLVKACCGLEVNNRQSVVYLPRQVGAQGFNEMITNTGKWVRDECNAEDEESEAFRDLTICGEGWTEMRMDFDEESTGKTVIERIFPLEMGVNKGATRANYQDARLLYRIRDMDPDDVRAIPGIDPNFNDAALDASKWLETLTTPEDGGIGNKKDYPDETRSGARGGKRGGRKTVRVIQAQYWKREPVNVVAVGQEEDVQHLSDDEFDKFKERADLINNQAEEAGEQAPMTYDHVRTMRKVYYECFIGNSILSVTPLKMGCFQFNAMTGDRDTKKKCFRGMVWDMIDPQQWSNKWLSQTMHLMNTNAKGGLMAETDAFVDVKKAESSWADPTKIVWVKPGAISKNKIKERTPSPLPAGLENLMMFAISSIRDVTGINLELLGQADREQAASLEQQRRQSAMTILATLFDSLRKYRKISGKLLLRFIWLLPEQTLVRVVEQGEYKYIPLIKEGMDMEKFDVIIDQAPTSPDQKQFVWAVTAQILQMNILTPPAIVALLKYSPYPESVVQEIRAALGLDGDLPPDQLKVKLQQAEEALKMLEQQLQELTKRAETAEDKATIELLKVQIDEYRAKTERMEADFKARMNAVDAIVGAHTAVNPPPAAPPADQGGQPGDQLPPVQDGDDIHQKVDQLTAMVQQLLQGGQPPAQPAESAPPQPVVQPEPMS